jgi:hypothetical protein
LTQFYKPKQKETELQVLAVEEDRMGRQESAFCKYLQECYGSTMRPHRVTFLNNKYLQLCQKPTRFQTEQQEIVPLLEAINWRALLFRQLTALDPFSGSDTIRTYFTDYGIGLDWTTNDIDPSIPATYHVDACNPAAWKRFPLTDCIISTPPWELLDGIVPLMEKQAQLFSAIHVQGDYVTSAPIYRQIWLAQLVKEQRLCIIQGLARPKTRDLRGGIWIIVFRDKQSQSIFWHPTTILPTYLHRYRKTMKPQHGRTLHINQTEV